MMLTAAQAARKLNVSTASLREVLAETEGDIDGVHRVAGRWAIDEDALDDIAAEFEDENGSEDETGSDNETDEDE